MRLDRVELAKQSYGRALAEARRAATPRAWSRLLRAARNLRWAREERGAPLPRTGPRERVPEGPRPRPRPRPRLLVVEDDRDLREALVELLRSEGFDVRSAHDGRAALDALAPGARRPELVILDLDLPGLSGWAVREQMLSDPALAGVPVIVLTGSSGTPPRAVRRVPKPFEVHDLVRAVEHAAGAR